jgi:predicted secreted protein
MFNDDSMASIFRNVLSSEDIQYLNNLPEVLEAKNSPSGRFSIELTDSIRSALATIGLDLSGVTTIPMRWMKGDTVPHTDKGSKYFANTFLVYLNDSTGEFVLGSNSYPITANTAFVFNEGISHKTVGTTPRLLLGPMSELADPVGNPFTPQPMNYFPTQTDAQNITNLLYQSSAFYIRNLSQDPGGFTETYSAWAVDGTNTISIGYHGYPYTLGQDTPVDGYTEGDGFGQYYLYPVFIIYYTTVHDIIYDINQLSNSSTSYTIDTVNGISNWSIHSSSTGTSSQNGVYTVGDTLATGGTYYLYQTVVLYYYASQADALAQTNSIGSSTSYTLDTVGGHSNWRIASNSTGSSSQSGAYTSGSSLTSGGVYYLYPNVPCFLEGSTILCSVDGNNVYLPIETIKPGTLVKTHLSGNKAVALIGKSQLQNPSHEERIQNRLYKCSPSKYPALTDDLYITGCHSILVDSMTDEQKEKTKEQLGQIFITENKYRLMAYLDERAEPWNSEGTYTIWHMALENEDVRMNYGVWSNGLLVETCSINYMKNWSDMTLI